MDTEEPIRLTDHCIRSRNIDRDAMRVLRRLHDFGFYAYLVGGSVRDLLIGRKPKDFDVVTSAQPQEIKRLFRRCRLIGRRFRLAHIMGEDGKIIETATFRAKPKDLEQGQLIFDDNQFGTPRSDALRRDFTVNGLFYDAHRDEVIDYADGLSDLSRRLLRTIGNPVIRFREDPVRMLRAVKFAARLNFTIEEQTRGAILSERAEIGKAALPRLYEEISRLIGGGASLASVRLLDDLRLLEVLVPELAATLSRASQSERDRIDSLFKTLDTSVQNECQIPNGLLFAALMWPVVEAIVADLPEVVPPSLIRTLVEELTRPLAIRVCVPRRVMECAIAAIEGQLHFPRIARKKQTRAAFSRTPHYADTLAFAALRSEAGQMPSALTAQWEKTAVEYPPRPQQKRERTPRRRHRGRRNNRSDTPQQR
jgi:poly(A) polymerase